MRQKTGEIARPSGLLGRSMNFKPYGYLVAHIQIFCDADTSFDGHKITAVFGEKGGLEFGSADPNMDWNYAPPVCY